MKGLTIDDPLAITDILALDYAMPGDTFYLRGGTYDVDGMVMTLARGLESRTIKVKPYPGETVTMIGAMDIRGANLEFYDLIWQNKTPWTTRGFEQADNTPASGPSVYTTGTCKWINCIMRNCGQGIGFWEEIPGGLLYGCLIYYTGFLKPDRGHGHDIYVHNTSGIKLIQDNICFRAFSQGLHFYADASAKLQNVIFQGNTVFDSGLTATGMTPRENILAGAWGCTARGITLDENYTYHSAETHTANQIGYEPGNSETGIAADGVILTDNYMPDGLSLVNCANVTQSRNITEPETSGVRVFVRPNLYKTGRANVTIYNWDQVEGAAVDLSSVSGLSAGDTVTVINTLDYFVDRAEVTLDSDKTINIDLRPNSHSIEVPEGWIVNPTTLPTFGCFVVEKV